MTPEERDKAWMNQSIIHVDFMVWDESLTITWETYEGEKIEFFVNWKWNID
jgi:leucyl aminopeptidase (aminopeptidase T)